MEMALSQPIQKGQQVLSTSSWARKHGAGNWISDMQKDSGQVLREQKMDTCKLVVVVLVKDDLRVQKLNHQEFANHKMAKNSKWTIGR